MQSTELGDPRLQALFGSGEPRELGVLPVVRLPRSGPSGWMIAVGVLVAAILLFWALESRRTAPAEPSVQERAADARPFAPEPPALYIPPAPAPAPAPVIATETPEAPRPVPAAALESTAPSAVTHPQSYYAPEPMPAPQPVQVQPRAAGGSALVIDTGVPAPQPAHGESADGIVPTGVRAGGGRARASALANRSTTVPQGTLIPAVLETAFDSTRPGFARAIVSRDVRGFDGTKVLIPRGSRLVGEYSADASPGQKRAMISWTRLLRPDGTMIAIDSPAVDSMGRGGVRAKVNSHFWGRFGDALLGTVMNAGGMLASRQATGSVVVALPGSTQTAAPAAQSGTVAPTLNVAAGTSISIFVAHDLDFGRGEGAP